MQREGESPPSEYERLRGDIQAMRNLVGDDSDLVKQLLSDTNAERRLLQSNNFESRKEYARQSFEAGIQRERAVTDFSMQTLRWLFLINAGAAVAIIAYAGSRAGADKTLFVQLAKSLWPFGVGAALIPFAGAMGYYNFLFARQQLPSREALNNFFDPSKHAVWPEPEGLRQGEKLSDFHSRTNRVIGWTQRLAVLAALLSLVSFGYGVYGILREIVTSVA
jgi:hypothetical protein